MKLFKKNQLICTTLLLCSIFIFSCSKLDDDHAVSPLGTSITFEEARFKEFDLVKSEKVNEKNAIIFESKDDVYSFLKR